MCPGACVHHRIVEDKGKGRSVEQVIIVIGTPQRAIDSAAFWQLETMEEEPSKYIKLIRYVLFAVGW